MVLKGNTETCISCGGRANLIDGIYRGTINSIEAIRAAKLNPEQTEKLKSLLENVDEDDADVDLDKSLEAISPALKSIAPILKSNPVIAIVLVAFIVFMNSVEIKVEINVQQIIDQALDYMERNAKEPSSGGTSVQQDGKDTGYSQEGAHPKPTRDGPQQDKIDILHGSPPNRTTAFQGKARRGTKSRNRRTKNPLGRRKR